MTSDTLVLLLDAVKVQRSESPLSWIDEDEGCKLKESMEDEFIGVDQLIHDAVISIRDLTGQCARGMTKVDPKHSSEDDPRVQSLKRHVTAKTKEEARKIEEDSEMKQRQQEKAKKGKKKGRER